MIQTHDQARHARELLGTRPDATVDDINIAYRRLVRALHPDSADPDTPRSATLAEAQAARDLLRRLAHVIQHHDPPSSPRRHDLDPPRLVSHRPDVRAGPVRYHGPAHLKPR